MWDLGEMLHCLPNEAKLRVTGWEFQEFQAWQSVKMKRREKWEYYAAQIAGYQSGQEKFKVKEFLLEFSTTEKKPVRMSTEQVANMVRRAFGV